MNWNYRVIRKELGNSITFQIHEVYYNDDGSINAWTEQPVLPLGESCGELREDIRFFLSAFRKDVLKHQQVDGVEKLVPAYDEEQEINSGHYFELMDRTYVALEHWIEFIGNHPVVKKNEEVLSIFEKAEDALAELYQLAAKLDSDHNDNMG